MISAALALVVVCAQGNGPASANPPLAPLRCADDGVTAGSVIGAGVGPVALAGAAQSVDQASPAGAAPAPAAGGDDQPPASQIVVTGRGKPPPSDPLERINETTYQVTQKVDDTVVAPLANGYRKALPSPLRSGLHNFLTNLTEPVMAFNYLLQIKPGKAAETVARFGINTTIGIGGLADVAKKKPFNLPYHRNGLANTLGFYGIGPGPYMFLPLVGPTTLRDLFGLTIDRAIMPFAIGGPLRSPYYVVPSVVVKALDDRIEADTELNRIRDAEDPYVFYRRTYLQVRRDEIEALHGRGPLAKGAVGVWPFMRPVGTPPDAQILRPSKSVTVPAPVLEAPATEAPAPEAPAAAVAPPPPPAPVFISEPVVQPLPAGH